MIPPGVTLRWYGTSRICSDAEGLLFSSLYWVTYLLSVCQ